MSLPRKIRVLVVDDSALVRRIISEALSNVADMEVVGTATDPYVARDKIVNLAPDILTLDIEMPRMDGLTFLKILMEKHPMPVIILSSLTYAGSHKVIEALRLGAVDVLAKPQGSFSLGETSSLLADKIRAAMNAAQRKKIHSVAPVKTERVMVAERTAPTVEGVRPVMGTTASGWHPRQIGLIGASTGGTEAIREVLQCMPEGLPPLCLVQHLPAFISKAFSERLDSVSAYRVREAEDGDILENGLALLAPGDFHMTLQWTGLHYKVRLNQSPKIWYQRPAVDVLFRSAVRCVGTYAVAALLTGMGKDGGAGMLELRQAGNHTIAQDEESCVVYGMPKTAVELGGASEVVSLDKIAERMIRGFQMVAHKQKKLLGGCG